MNINKERIMIVDDDKDFLRELKETLYLCGYNIKTVSDSSTAFRIARKIKPDAILLDMKMNKKNGFHVAEELKQSNETSGIPIIAMSGYFPIEKDFILLDYSNMKARIKKPFSISVLIDEIERVSRPAEKTG